MTSVTFRIFTVSAFVYDMGAKRLPNANSIESQRTEAGRTASSGSSVHVWSCENYKSLDRSERIFRSPKNPAGYPKQCDFDKQLKVFPNLTFIDNGEHWVHRVTTEESFMFKTRLVQIWFMHANNHETFKFCIPGGVATLVQCLLGIPNEFSSVSCYSGLLFGEKRFFCNVSHPYSGRRGIRTDWR